MTLKQKQRKMMQLQQRLVKQTDAAIKFFQLPPAKTKKGNSSRMFKALRLAGKITATSIEMARLQAQPLTPKPDFAPGGLIGKDGGVDKIYTAPQTAFTKSM